MRITFLVHVLETPHDPRQTKSSPTGLRFRPPRVLTDAAGDLSRACRISVRCTRPAQTQHAHIAGPAGTRAVGGPALTAWPDLLWPTASRLEGLLPPPPPPPPLPPLPPLPPPSAHGPGRRRWVSTLAWATQNCFALSDRWRWRTSSHRSLVAGPLSRSSLRRALQQAILPPPRGSGPWRARVGSRPGHQQGVARRLVLGGRTTDNKAPLRGQSQQLARRRKSSSPAGGA